MNTQNRLQIAKQKLEKLAARKDASIVEAVCEITGIAYKMEVPTIKLGNSVLEYKNPLARYENFSEIAKLPVKELQQFDSAILAGLLLASLQFHNLLRFTKDATAASYNILIQEKIHPSKVIEAFRFYASIPTDNKIHLPQLVLQERMQEERGYVSLSSVLSTHLEDCRQCLYGEETHPAYVYGEAEKLAALRIIELKKAKQAARNKQAKTIRQNALIKEAKVAIQKLEKIEAVSKKLIHFCKLLFNDGYIKVAEQETKDRAIKALAILPYEEAAELRRIISSELFSIALEIEDGNEEALFLQEKDLEVEEELEEVESEKQEQPEKQKKRTIAEILASKVKKQQ